MNTGKNTFLLFLISMSVVQIINANEVADFDQNISNRLVSYFKYISGKSKDRKIAKSIVKDGVLLAGSIITLTAGFFIVKYSRNLFKKVKHAGKSTPAKKGEVSEIEQNQEVDTKGVDQIGDVPFRQDQVDQAVTNIKNITVDKTELCFIGSHFWHVRQSKDKDQKVVICLRRDEAKKDVMDNQQFKEVIARLKQEEYVKQINIFIDTTWCEIVKQEEGWREIKKLQGKEGKWEEIARI